MRGPLTPFSPPSLHRAGHLRTGEPRPSTAWRHGFFDPVMRKPWFWEQSADLVAGPRIGRSSAPPAGTVGAGVHQQASASAPTRSYSPADPSTAAADHGLLRRPADFADRLARSAGSSLRLQQYWGPPPRSKSSD
jgi:hypothetical protein